MKYKKIASIVICMSLLIFLSVQNAFAVTYTGPSSSWAYSSYSHGSYVPKSGKMTSTFYDVTTDYLKTSVSFVLDKTNVDSIIDYNNGGDNPGTVADNKNCYLTLDQTTIGDSWDIEISATSVVSNLPDPKYDLESNVFVGENDESEVVALGKVASATSYNMTTSWNDYRDGDAGDSGKIQAQFAMSDKGVFDYNNVVQSDVVQAKITYGNNLGKP